MTIPFEDLPELIAKAIQNVKKYPELYADDIAAQTAYRRVMQLIAAYAHECEQRDCPWLIKQHVPPFVKYTQALLAFPHLMKLIQDSCEKVLKPSRIYPRLQHRVLGILVASMEYKQMDYFWEREYKEDYQRGLINIPLADAGETDITLYLKTPQLYPTVWTKEWEKHITRALITLSKEFAGVKSYEQGAKKRKRLQEILKKEYNIKWLDYGQTEELIDKETEEIKAIASAKRKPQYLVDLEVKPDDSDEVAFEKLRKASAYILKYVWKGFKPSNNYEWSPVVYHARAALLFAKNLAANNGPYTQVLQLVHESWDSVNAVSLFYKYTDQRTLFEIMYELYQLIHQRPRFSLKILKRMHSIHKNKPLSAFCEDEWIESEVAYFEKNIKLAAEGKFGEIIQREGELNRDPIEWTERWEELIDKAEEKAEAELANHPRGADFQQVYWKQLERILYEDYDFIWHAPDQLNPKLY